MRVMLATLLLNEQEWVEQLYKQHRNWPGLVCWAMVEAADYMYAEANPTLVSGRGLSVDNTTVELMKIESYDSKVQHIRFGVSHHPDPAQGKIPARNAYLRLADEIKPDIIVVLDADEFYTEQDQHRINRLASMTDLTHRAYMLRTRHIWYPDGAQCKKCDGTGSILSPIPQCEPPRSYHHDCPDCGGNDFPLFDNEVVGGYWQVPHTRLWRWEEGMRYVKNHNWPEDTQGRYLTTKRMLRADLIGDLLPMKKVEGGGLELPQCVHMGYASSANSRKSKHRYYEVRGEGQEEGRIGVKRRMYVECRRAYENWKPGMSLPHGARVIPYTGPVPECFK